MKQKVCAIILAAGSSSRMGQLKQLLPLGDHSMLEHVIDRVLQMDFTEVYTVIGKEAERIKRNITIHDTRFHWLMNEDYTKGQSTSLKIAWKHLLPTYQHIMIFLGDLPFIHIKTIEKIMMIGHDQIKANKHPLFVRPTNANMPGHPVFIGNMTENLVKGISGDQGLKTIRHAFTSEKIVPVDDPMITFDIDTPDDYKKAMHRYASNNLIE